MKLTKLYKNILLEYSEKVIKELVSRYRRQNSNLDEETIIAYANRFNNLKGSLKQRFDRGEEIIKSAIPKELQEKNKYLDILQYKKWSDLEKIVDLFPASKSQQKKAIENSANTDADKIYSKNDLEIFRGDAEHKCVYYGNNIGNNYSWCITRPGSSNMYSNYRFMNSDSRMFYFVFDKSRSSKRTKEGGLFEDKYHAVVIHTFEDGRYGFSNADNAGDKIVKSWDELGPLMPTELWAKIKPLKDVFKYVPPSTEEKEMAALKGKSLTLEQFKELSYNTKLLYINAGNKLTPEQINTLDVDLKSQYINVGNPMPFEAVSTNLPLIKRYITIQFDRKDNPVNSDYLKYMNPEQKQKYFDKYGEEWWTSYQDIIDYFPEEIDNFVKQFIEELYYLPDEFEKYMTSQQKGKWESYMPIYLDTKVVHSRDENVLIDKSWLNPLTLTLDKFKTIPPNQKHKFFGLFYQLIKSGKINNYPHLKYCLPKYEIKGDKLYFDFENKLYGEDTQLDESVYDDWSQYSLLRKAGIIK